MDSYTSNLVGELENIISSIDDKKLDSEYIINGLKEQLRDDRNQYFQLQDPELKNKIKHNIIMDYNLIYCYQYRKNKRKTYVMEDNYKVPIIYVLDQVPEKFDIDVSLLDEINIEDGLTNEQALELLKWTANNTRDNLNIELDADVYGNDSLAGFCGFSQFSSLYPLQQMGLEVTINNISDMTGCCSHAFGTVILPIKEDNKIVDKRYLIDCTYRQFFDVSENCVARYLDSFPDSEGPKLGPSAGYFINKNEKMEFAKELLKNGFIEATEENLNNYFKPFFSQTVTIDETKKIDERFNQIDAISFIENNQRKFDFDETDFLNGKVNLALPNKNNKAFL